MASGILVLPVLDSGIAKYFNQVLEYQLPIHSG